MAFFQLDAEKLEPGDVILESGSGKISKLITVADRPVGARGDVRFSHVFVYVGMGQIMEADEGVRLLLANRVLTEEPERFLVLRHPEYDSLIKSSGWQHDAKHLIFMALHGEANKPYNWRGVLGVKFPWLGSAPNSFFCSQLVAEGYRRIGVPLFNGQEREPTPGEVTPNSFLTKGCLLREVEDCFHRLPDRPWVAELAANRYEVMKNEPIPLAQLTHQTAEQIVKLFGKRVDALTARINKVQTISSPQELYLTLAFPDLPEADQVSDELVAFMEMNSPVKQIPAFIELQKRSFEAGLAQNDPEVKALIIRTLRKDVASSEQLLPQLQLATRAMQSFPPPPLKRRSIHRWLEKNMRATVEAQAGLQQWRKTMLVDISAQP
jgi:hypothetical protein